MQPKRNVGFAPIRRGLLQHLPKMSDRASKLYVYFHLTCYFQGPKRGWLERSFEDIARGVGWNVKKTQRAVQELEGAYVYVERATSQYGLTRIKILKYDVEENAVTVDQSVHASEEAMDESVDTGVDKNVHNDVHTSVSISRNQQDLRAPKNVVEVSSVPTLCEQNQLVIGNGLNFVAHRLCK